MDGENIITWNVANWITIVLMVAIAFFLYGLVAKTIRSKASGNTPAAATTN
jgi:hypothetical protein